MLPKMRVATGLSANLVAFCLGMLAISQPVQAAAAPPVVVDSATMGWFHTFAQFASAAYCSKMGDGQASTSLCGSGACSARDDRPACRELLDATTVFEFDENRSITGNIAVSKRRKLIVLSFRGTVTTSLRDLMSDVKFCYREPRLIGAAIGLLCSWLPSTAADYDDPVLPLCKDCYVHKGFWTAFAGIKYDMARVIDEQRKANPGYSVVATGHSLGAAVATIAGAYLRKSGINTDIYTYGSPRVGDAAFASFVSNQRGGKTYRITNKADPVTLIPSTYSGYAHTEPEYWFPEGLERSSFLKKCPGVLPLPEFLCTAQFWFNPNNLPDHDRLGYTRQIKACPTDQGRGDPGVITMADIELWGLLNNGTEPMEEEKF